MNKRLPNVYGKHKFAYIVPNMAMKHWECYKDLILEALPPETASGNLSAVNLRTSVLRGSLELWAILCYNKWVGLLSLRNMIDPNTGTGYTLVYSLTTHQVTEPSMWDDGLAFLSDYARDAGTKKIVAYTGLEKLNTLLQDKGFSSHYVLSKEV